jgi:hypothetical protein
MPVLQGKTRIIARQKPAKNFKNKKKINFSTNFDMWKTFEKIRPLFLRRKEGGTFGVLREKRNFLQKILFFLRKCAWENFLAMSKAALFFGELLWK